MTQFPDLKLGTAAWSIPKTMASKFGSGESVLARYASVFSAVEINTSFYGPHQPDTYRRWAASTPAEFRFSVKIPKAISHQSRLVNCQHLLEEFLQASGLLGDKLGCLLLQLPPSFAFNASVAPFLCQLRQLYCGEVAIEPRHVSWWQDDAQATVDANRAYIVNADPRPVGLPPSCSSSTRPLRYFRLHGSPEIYWSSYQQQFLAELAAVLSQLDVPAWCIFDNTAAGAATANAMSVRSLLRDER